LLTVAKPRTSSDMKRPPSVDGGLFAFDRLFSQQLPRRRRASVSPHPFGGVKKWRIMVRIDSEAILVLDVGSKKSSKIPDEVIDQCQVRLKRYDASVKAPGSDFGSKDFLDPSRHRSVASTDV